MTEYAEIGWKVLMGLAGVCVAWNQIDDFFKRRSGKDNERTIQQPLVITAAEKFVHRDDFERQMLANQTEHQNIFSKMGGIERGMRQALKDDVDALHEKVNRANETIAAVNKGMEFQNQQLLNINHTMTRILEGRKS